MMFVAIATFRKMATAIVIKFTPLEFRDNCATSNNMKLVNWPLMGGLLHWVGYSEEGTGRGRNQPCPLLAVPNVTAHP